MQREQSRSRSGDDSEPWKRRLCSGLFLLKIYLNDVRLLLDYLNSCPPLIEKRKRVSSFLFALLSLHCHRTEVDPTDSSFYDLTTVRTTGLRITSLKQSGLCWVGVPATHPAEGVPIPVVLYSKVISFVT